MRLVKCNQCNAMLINGVYCHETGCVNAGQSPVLMARTYYTYLVSTMGKFEGAPSYVPYFWDVYLDGSADRDNDGILGFDIQKEDKEIFPELLKRRTVKLRETDQGFVVEV